MFNRYLAQIKFEFISAIKNVEQQLISLIIPTGVLVAGKLLGDFENLLSIAIGISILGSNLTGPAIGMAFDRRYGSIKGWAFTPIGVPGYLLGRIGALGIFAVLQTLILIAVQQLLQQPIELHVLTLPGLLGLQIFAASLATLMASRLRAEAVLASANLLLFGLAATTAFFNAGIASYLHPLSAWVNVTQGSYMHLVATFLLAIVAYVTSVKNFKWD